MQNVHDDDNTYMKKTRPREPWPTKQLSWVLRKSKNRSDGFSFWATKLNHTKTIQKPVRGQI